MSIADIADRLDAATRCANYILDTELGNYMIHLEESSDIGDAIASHIYHDAAVALDRHDLIADAVRDTIKSQTH